MIMLIALVLGLAIPAGILFLIEFFRYKIEGHDDVAALTKLPIIGDVAIASDQAKTKADIVVHANQNNLMEEVFRSIRANIQFMLKGGREHHHVHVYDIKARARRSPQPTFCREFRIAGQEGGNRRSGHP